MNMTCKEILDQLNKMANPDIVISKKIKFGIIAQNSLGITHKDLKEFAKKFKPNKALALELFASNVYEARILCSKLIKPNEVTDALMESWVKTFDNWEICDTYCMGLFAKSELAVSKAIQWSEAKGEFEKRAGYAIIAAYCMADKKAANEVFLKFLNIIEKHAFDDRLYVKKAVNWALRNIGKRNKDLHQAAVLVANKLLHSNNKAAVWIAKDALKELQGANVNMYDYPREIYRK